MNVMQGWLGGTKMKPIIPFDKVVIFLHKKAAPREVCRFLYVRNGLL